jgi:SAM-dependent methyltransferase
MKNIENWTPTKFAQEGGRLKASQDPASVAVSSRLNVNLLAAALQPALKAHAHGRLLDLGCGNVPLYAAYRDYVSDVTCMDWANSEHQLRHIDQACDLNEPLPLSDSCFDTVLLTDVLEHIANPGALVNEIGRILTPGGKLIGSVPFTYRLHEEPYDYYRYTRHALRRLAQQSGLEVCVLEPYGQGLDVIFDSLGKVIVDAHWRWGPRLSACLQEAGLKFRTSRLGLRLNSANENMPLGYIVVLRR